MPPDDLATLLPEFTVHNLDSTYVNILSEGTADQQTRDCSPSHATAWETPVINGWDDVDGEGAQLLPRKDIDTLKKPQSVLGVTLCSPTPGGDAAEQMQWQALSGLLLYAVCTLCSSGAIKLISITIDA